MTTPRATPTVLTDPPALDGGTAPLLDAPAATPSAPSVFHAWADQEIDTAGTEADLWLLRGDGSA